MPTTGPRRRRRSPGSAVAVAVALAALLGTGAPSAEAAEAAPVIVLLRDGVEVDAAVGKARRETGRAPSHVYRHAIRGYATRLTPGQRRQLARDGAVDAIVPDTRAELTAQSIPPGIRRVGATLAPATDIDGRDGSVDDGQRVDADIAIIDTGITRHPDLNVAGGVNCTGEGPATAWGDGNGHGTHVAGVAAALDNGFGVVGTAPGARLWAVRVFRPDGYSRISWIVCGIDWITAQRDPDNPDRPLIEVANMSLRDEGRDDGACGYENADAEHRAICRSVAAGITYVVSSGNDRRVASLWRPASYDEVITVSAIADYDGRAGGAASPTCTSFGVRDLDDTFADFANYGNDVDITAPGVCVRSTIPGGYGTISGTSMSTPAVAGAAAVYRALHPDATPAEVRLALRAAGSLDWRTSTDRDLVHEPLLDMRSFGAEPGFTLGALPSRVRAWSGVGSVGVDVRVTRGNGFAGTINLDVEGLPAGVSASWSSDSLVGLGAITSRLALRAEPGTPPGVTPLTLVARSGGRTSTAIVTLEVAVDATRPSLVGPRARIVRPQTVGSFVRVRAFWSASDGGTGLARIDAAERREGGSWTALALATATAASVDRSLRLGSPTEIRVSAVDRAGNVAGPQNATFTPSGRSEGSARYSSGWRTSSATSAWGGRLRSSTTRGASATVTVTGRAVAWVSTLGPTRGKARVYVDGTLVRTVDLYATSTRYRQVVFERAWSSAGRHTIRIVVVGTAGRARVDVDGFVVIP